MDAETDADAVPDAAAAAKLEETVKLRVPIKWGDGVIEELTLKANAEAMKSVTLPIQGDGDEAAFIIKPYDLAQAGLLMAGHPPAALKTLMKRLHPADMMEVAQVVMGFLGLGPETGPTP